MIITCIVFSIPLVRLIHYIMYSLDTHCVDFLELLFIIDSGVHKNGFGGDLGSLTCKCACVAAYPTTTK